MYTYNILYTPVSYIEEIRVYSAVYYSIPYCTLYYIITLYTNV